MKKNYPVFQHFPLITPQLFVNKDENGNPIGTRLSLFIDSDEDDLNRVLRDLIIEEPHNYDFSIEFEGFNELQGGSDCEKYITGSVYLICSLNKISNRLQLDPPLDNRRIKLSEPKLKIYPLKKATAKAKANWQHPAEISDQIQNIWLEVFSAALSGYLVQSYNLFNAKSIAEVTSQNSIPTDIDSTKSNQYSIATPKQPLIKGLFNHHKTTLAIGSYAIIISLVMCIALVKFVFFSSTVNSPSSDQNFTVPTNVMSLEEAKNAQLRELGINPEDLAADLGCFVE